MYDDLIKKKTHDICKIENDMQLNLVETSRKVVKTTFFPNNFILIFNQSNVDMTAQSQCEYPHRTESALVACHLFVAKPLSDLLSIEPLGLNTSEM